MSDRTDPAPGASTLRAPAGPGPATPPARRGPTHPGSFTGAALVLGLILAAAPRPAAGQSAFEFRQLAPGVVAAVVDPGVPSYAFANALVVVGEDGVLVVDTQQSPRATLQVLAEIRRRTPLPVRWVVNTHWHPDHLWGNQVYADTFPGAVFLATAATRDTLAARWADQVREQREHTLGSRARLDSMLAGEGDAERRDAIEAAIQVRGRYLDDLAGLHKVPWDRIVRDSLRLDLGGRDVVLLHVGPAHTPGDLVVWVPDAGVAHVGDLIEEGELWTEGADLDGWVAALDRVEALAPRVLVPGHGGIQRDLELLRAQREQLRGLAAPDGPSR